MKKLEKAKKKGDVDPGIVSLLDYLNSLEDFYTTSSCAGRITLLHDVGSKRDDKWLGKWHRPVELEEVMDALNEIPGKGIVWFKYEPAILHIVARSLDGAGRILKTARNHGFKRAGVMALKKERYMIEIFSTEKIDAPLAVDGRFLVENKYVKYLIALADKQFKEGRGKLKKLEEGFREDLS